MRALSKNEQVKVRVALLQFTLLVIIPSVIVWPIIIITTENSLIGHTVIILFGILYVPLSIGLLRQCIAQCIEEFITSAFYRRIIRGIWLLNLTYSAFMMSFGSFLAWAHFLKYVSQMHNDLSIFPPLEMALFNCFIVYKLSQYPARHSILVAITPGLSLSLITLWTIFLSYIHQVENPALVIFPPIGLIALAYGPFNK